MTTTKTITRGEIEKGVEPDQCPKHGYGFRHSDCQECYEALVYSEQAKVQAKLRASAKPTATDGTRKQWATQVELDAMQPKYYDLRQTAVTANNTWTFCGTNAWFKTSGD